MHFRINKILCTMLECLFANISLLNEFVEFQMSVYSSKNKNKYSQ